MTETRRLYYEDVYKKEFTATVVELQRASGQFPQCGKAYAGAVL